MALSLFGTDPFRSFFGSPVPAHFGALAQQADDMRMLAVDVKETETGFSIKADLPGYDKDALKVRVHDGVLSIDAERKREEETKDDKGYRMERFYGKVHRSIRLPPTADQSAVSAGYDNGVLSVTVGKRALEDIAGRDIDIE